MKTTTRRSRVASMAANLRDALHTLADQLPEGATCKDVAYEAYVRQEIEAGLEEARRGDFATDDEVNPPSPSGECRLKLKSTRRALEQLVEAQDYIAQDNPTAARQVGERIAEATRLLLTQPRMGHRGRGG